MRLKNGFITHESDGEQIMVAAGEVRFSGMVRSNKTAAFIVDCLKEETTEAQIVEKLSDVYDAPKEVIAGDVQKILDSLRSIGALDE